MISQWLCYNSFSRIVVLGIVLLVVLTSCKNPNDTKIKRPNIILIMADDLGYEGLSCNGSSSYKTPNLDKLAEEGVRFTNCYSTPLCTTSRVQLMTGMYNFRNYTEFGTMPAGQTTFAHILKKAGYSTCVAGKWQLVGKYEGAGYKGEGTYPEQNGFDEYCLWQLDRFGSRYWEPLLNTNGTYHQFGNDDYGPDIVCDFILDYIERHRSDPFLIYYPMILTHDPFVPTPDSEYSEKEKNINNKIYFSDMVEYTDKIIGKIIEKLNENNLHDNTLIIFIGDNGTHKSIVSQMNGTPIRGAKGKTTSYGTHVPMIASWKKQGISGYVSDDLIDFTDFLPSLVEAADIKDYSIPHKDGRSFLPQIVGGISNPREWIFCDYNPKWGKHEKRRYSQTKEWKLYDDGSFYDYTNDPEEQNPISISDLSVKDLEVYNELQNVLAKFKSSP